jgi:hypothetical protein
VKTGEVSDQGQRNRCNITSQRSPVFEVDLRDDQMTPT